MIRRCVVIEGERMGSWEGRRRRLAHRGAKTRRRGMDRPFQGYLARGLHPPPLVGCMMT